MDSDEAEIWNFLNSCPGEFVSPIEISRRASGRRRYKDEPKWALRPIQRLLDQKIIETDGNGHYRLPPTEQKSKAKRWIAPHIRKILKESGKDFEEVDLDAPEDPKGKGSGTGGP
jgi:hypothetical protein